MINSFHVGGGLDVGRDSFPRARGKDDLGWIMFRRAGNRRMRMHYAEEALFDESEEASGRSVSKVFLLLPCHYSPLTGEVPWLTLLTPEVLSRLLRSAARVLFAFLRSRRSTRTGLPGSSTYLDRRVLPTTESHSTN